MRIFTGPIVHSITQLHAQAPAPFVLVITDGRHGAVYASVSATEYTDIRGMRSFTFMSSDAQIAAIVSRNRVVFFRHLER